MLEKIIDEKLNEYLPTKTLKITQKDKMWITAELKKDRQSKKERMDKKGEIKEVSGSKEEIR